MPPHSKSNLTKVLGEVEPARRRWRSTAQAAASECHDELHEMSAARGTLLANVLWFANVAISCGTTLALMPILIRTLGEDQYALWIAVSALTGYLGLTEAGLGQTVVNWVGDAYARGDIERIQQTQATAYLLYWLLVIPVGLLTICALLFLPVDKWLLSESDAHNGGLLIVCLMIATVLALARIPFMVFPAMLTAFRELPIRLVLEAATTLVAALGTVAAAVLGLGLVGVTLSANIILLTATVAAYLLSLRGRPWAKLQLSNFRLSHVRTLATTSGFFFLISGSYLFDRSMLNLLVAKMGSLALVAPMFLLMCVFRVAGWSVLSAVSRSVQPYVIYWRAQRQENRIRFVSQFSTKITCLAGVLIALPFVPLAEPLINWWLGRPCFPGMIPMLFIAGSFLLDGVFLTSVNMLVVLDRHRVLAVILAVRALFMLAACVVLASFVQDPIVGLSGGVFLATLAGNLFLPLLFRQAVCVETKHYVDHFLVRPILFCALFTLAAACIASVPSLWAKMALSSAAVLLACMAAWLALFDASERSACWSIVQRIGAPLLRDSRVDAS